MLVADYLIANSEGSLTPLHIIKLAYFSHGYTLAIHDRPLISERVEAWPYGPVIPILYNYVKRFGDSPVTMLPYCSTSVFGDGIKERKRFLNKALEKETDVIDAVLQRYGTLTGHELIRLTHTEGSPWDQCYVKRRREIIPTQVTKEYYKELIS